MPLCYAPLRYAPHGMLLLVAWVRGGGSTGLTHNIHHLFSFVCAIQLWPCICLSTSTPYTLNTLYVHTRRVVKCRVSCLESLVSLVMSISWLQIHYWDLASAHWYIHRQHTQPWTNMTLACVLQCPLQRVALPPSLCWSKSAMYRIYMFTHTYAHTRTHTHSRACTHTTYTRTRTRPCTHMMYTRTGMYTCVVHSCTDVYMYIWIYVHMYICLYVCTCKRVLPYNPRWVNSDVIFSRTHMYTPTCACKHM